MPSSISVVIPALNEAANIRRAIASAWAAQVGEVIVVDGGSRDGTMELAQSEGARVYSCQRCRAWQQNRGAGESKGETLLFLHADNWLSPDAGKQIGDCLKNHNVLGGAFRQQIHAEGLVYRLIEKGNALRVRARGLPFGDQAIFMRRKIFERLGRFPNVLLMEDLLLMSAFRKIARPVLLPGPVHVDARRWKQQGVLRQTLSNWALVAAQRLGASPDRLAKFYPPHQGPSE